MCCSESLKRVKMGKTDDPGPRKPSGEEKMFSYLKEASRATHTGYSTRSVGAAATAGMLGRVQLPKEVILFIWFIQY